MHAKCLSVRQPWAWLIVHGHKPLENRSWATSYRGPLLIHAAKGMTRAECVDDSPSLWFFGKYGFELTDAKPLPFMPCKGRLGLFDVEYQEVANV